MNKTAHPSTRWWNKKRIIASALAVALLMGIFTAGTFAWNSISQKALNEAKADNILPGGRLHDDFDGQNKDVYVENYGTIPIYARIQLSEYMEIGSGAGLKSGDAGYDEKEAQSLVAGAIIDDPTTWNIHDKDTTAASDALFHNYWNWTQGGQKVFMPTFNKDKTSNATDVTGKDTFGITSDDYQHRVSDPVFGGNADAGKDGSHNQYAAGETKTATATYKSDSKTETHTAQSTLPGSVITMQAWVDGGCVPGPYWVVDTDGWAYWAQAIEPSTATGLLLDQITLTYDMDDNWYYAIDVVGQMASLNDIDQIKDGTAAGQHLIDVITAGDIIGVTISGAASVIPGGTAQFTAIVIGTNTNIDRSVTWTVDGDSEAMGITIDADGTLNVPTTVPKGTEVTVTATSVQDTSKSDSKVVTVVVYSQKLDVVFVLDVTSSMFTATGDDKFQTAKETLIDAANTIWDANPESTVTVIPFARNAFVPNQTVGLNYDYVGSAFVWKRAIGAPGTPQFILGYNKPIVIGLNPADGAAQMEVASSLYNSYPYYRLTKDQADQTDGIISSAYQNGKIDQTAYDIYGANTLFANAVWAIPYGEDTNTEAGLQEAYNLIKNDPAFAHPTQDSTAVILITDGQANRSNALTSDGQPANEPIYWDQSAAGPVNYLDFLTNYSASDSELVRAADMAHDVSKKITDPNDGNATLYAIGVGISAQTAVRDSATLTYPTAQSVKDKMVSWLVSPSFYYDVDDATGIKAAMIDIANHIIKY